MKRLSAVLKICLIVLSGFGIMHASTFDLVSYTIEQQLEIAQTESIEEIPTTSQSQPSISTAQQIRRPNADIFSENAQWLSAQLMALRLLEAGYGDSIAHPQEAAPAPENEFFEIGQHVKLLPKEAGPDIQFPGTFQFLAHLENPHRDKTWRVQVEATVTHEDGSTRTAIKPRAILRFPGQTLELPVKVKARQPRYQPGLTLFTALIKDMSGQIIDQATITFNLENQSE